jgi:outer membrane receptor protein involved in Fe transport
MFSSPLVKNASDRLTLAGGLVYVGDRYATENNQIELTSYVRLDLMARYELAENTSFQLNLQNVTDTRYFTGGNIDAGFTGSVTPGQPLTVTASVTHEF